MFKFESQVYVIDSADRMRIDESSKELQALLEEEKLAGIPMLIYANQKDLTNAMSSDEVRSRRMPVLCFAVQQPLIASKRQLTEVLSLDQIGDRTWHIQHCSGKAMEGLQDGMDWLVKNIKKD
jgi:ADP-ribosylation factor-like protein 3